MTNKEAINILHLSDLHLGQLNDKNELEHIFKSLFDKLGDQKIDYIAVSGDISFRNAQSGFNLGEEFIKKIPGIKKKDGRIPNLFICPGNHDVDRDVLAQNLQSILREKESDDHRIVDTPTNRSKVFENKESITTLNNAFRRYDSFCKGLIDPYQKDTDDPSCFTYGFKIVDNTCFLILNSAWYCTGGKLLLSEDGKKSEHSKDLENLYIGKALVKRLFKAIKTEVEKEGKDLNELLKVTLVHHPPNWLNWNEKYVNDSQSKLKSAWDLVLDFSDIILTGHEHIEIKKPSLIHQSSLLFRAGPTYVSPESDNDFYSNHTCLLQISLSDFSVTRKIFYYYGKTGDRSASWKFRAEDRACKDMNGCSSDEECLNSCPFDKYYFRRTIYQCNNNSIPISSLEKDQSDNGESNNNEKGQDETIALKDFQIVNSNVDELVTTNSGIRIPLNVPMSDNDYFILQNDDILLINENIGEFKEYLFSEIVKELINKNVTAYERQKLTIEINPKLNFSSFRDHEKATLRSLIILKRQVSSIIHKLINKLNLEVEAIDMRNILLRKDVTVLVVFK